MWAALLPGLFVALYGYRMQHRIKRGDPVDLVRKYARSFMVYAASTAFGLLVWWVGVWY